MRVAGVSGEREFKGGINLVEHHEISQVDIHG
jgi:hypothetical protein